MPGLGLIVAMLDVALRQKFMMPQGAATRSNG
jgi:hypothetical protein